MQGQTPEDSQTSQPDGEPQRGRRLIVRAAAVALGMLALVIGGLALLSFVSGEPFLPMDYGAFD